MQAQFSALNVRVALTNPDEDTDVIEVWDINAKVARVFFDLTTQWRVVTLSTMEMARLVRVGIDYSAVPVVLRAHGLRDRDGTVFAGLRIMERAALDAFSEASA